MNSELVRSRAWMVYLAVYAAVLVSCLFVPFGVALVVYYGVLAWSRVLVMLGRLLVDRRHQAGALWLLAGCEACTGTGFLLYILLDPPSPGPHDAVFLVGGLSGIVGMVWLVRRQTRGRDRESLLDALVVTASFALLCWVFLIEPARSTAGSLQAGVVAVSYPLMDLFVLALLVRLLLDGGLRNPAMRLIAAAQLTFLASDAGFAFVPPALAQNEAVFHVLIACSNLVFGLFGAAALHPKFTSITVDRAVARSEQRWLRTALLCVAVLTGPALLLAQAWRNDSRVPNAAAIAVGCAVIFALVVARLQTSRQPAQCPIGHAEAPGGPAAGARLSGRADRARQPARLGRSAPRRPAAGPPGRPLDYAYNDRPRPFQAVQRPQRSPGR